MSTKKLKRQAKQYSYYEYLRKFQPQSLPDENKSDCQPLKRRERTAFSMIRDSWERPPLEPAGKTKRD